MPTYITIPDTFYTEAAEAIADVRRLNETGANAAGIEKMLRSYVYLGSHQEVVDWSYALSEATKDDVLSAILNRTQSAYQLTLSTARTRVDLDIMETLAARGDVSPNIARPREAQERLDEGIIEAHKNDLGFLDHLKNGIEQVFGVLKSAADSVLKGLGINIPVEALLALAAAVVLYFVVPRRA
jgi:hypothetical protein